MTKRERLLLVSVGAMLVVIGGIALIDRVMTGFDQRYNRLLTLDEEVGDAERTILRGKAAEKKRQQWRDRSLPGDPALASSLYLNWLGDRAVAVEFSNINIAPLGGRREGEVYHQHAFRLEGEGSLRQLTQFLYDFYNVGYLHRISHLDVAPIGDSKQLDLKIKVEALSLNGAPDRESLHNPPAERLAYDEVQDYVDAIIQRNLFSPANKPPQVASLSAPEGHPDKPLTFQIGASDPDGDKLRYHLEAGPEGAVIDEETGEFRWTPAERGETEIAFRVTDNGVPPKSAAGSVQVAVVDAPRPVSTSPTFDPATMAKITGITSASTGQPEIWVNVRTEGKLLILREGDEFSVGTITGTVTKISEDKKRAEIKTSDGKTLVVELGETLVPAEGTDLGGI